MAGCTSKCGRPPSNRLICTARRVVAAARESASSRPVRHPVPSLIATICWKNYLPDTAGQQKSEPPHGETGARVKTKGEGGREQRVAGMTNRRACRACSEESERAKVSKIG